MVVTKLSIAFRNEMKIYLIPFSVIFLLHFRKVPNTLTTTGDRLKSIEAVSRGHWITF
jgi:hypothetical protein